MTDEWCDGHILNIHTFNWMLLLKVECSLSLRQAILQALTAISLFLIILCRCFCSLLSFLSGNHKRQKYVKSFTSNFKIFVVSQQTNISIELNGQLPQNPPTAMHSCYLKVLQKHPRHLFPRLYPFAPLLNYTLKRLFLKSYNNLYLPKNCLIFIVKIFKVYEPLKNLESSEKWQELVLNGSI